jgi:hypothetical protein
MFYFKELLRQGEQLDNIERKTTDMNQQMTTTQKHLNNIKSVFGRSKNLNNLQLIPKFSSISSSLGLLVTGCIICFLDPAINRVSRSPK